jgi:hypothetical protein
MRLGQTHSWDVQKRKEKLSSLLD